MRSTRGTSLAGKAEKSVSIRRAVPGDAFRVKKLEIDAGLSPWPAADYEKEAVRDGSLFFVAVLKNNDSLSGFILVRLITHIQRYDKGSIPLAHAELLNIAVSSENRRSGIGRRLLLEAVKHFEADTTNLNLEVRRSNNSAIAFYKDFGFVEVAIRPGLYRDPPEDGILLSMRINK